MRLNDVIGGHLVSGHVDGVGEVLRVSMRWATARLLEIRAPKEIAKFIARRRSRRQWHQLDDQHANGTDFTINRIPRTRWKHHAAPAGTGGKVDREVDLDRPAQGERLLSAEREG